MQETWEPWVPSLDWEDPLEESMATHSSILAWRIPKTEELDGLQYIGLQRVGQDWSDLGWTDTRSVFIFVFVDKHMWVHLYVYVYLCVCVHLEMCATLDTGQQNLKVSQSPAHTQGYTPSWERGWGKGSSLLARLSAGLCGAGCLSVWKRSAPVARSSSISGGMVVECDGW